MYFLYILVSSVALVNCIRFHLSPNTEKCLKEELHKNVLIVGDFEVSEVRGQSVNYVVKDSMKHVLAQNSNITRGKFSFSTENEDTFEICFKSKINPHHRGTVQEVSLNTKRGVEAKTYEALIVAGKLKPMEIELKKLEDLSAAIVEDFAHMKDRETAMRNTNESTNRRVVFLSICSTSFFFFIAAWQVLYLRRYFKSRKLIE